MSRLAAVDRDLGTLLVADHLAVLPGARLAVGGALHLAGEGVGHPGVSLRLWLVVPDLLLVLAHDLGHDEVDLLGHQLALLPRDWFTGLGSGPHLRHQLKYFMSKLFLTCFPYLSVSQLVTQFCLVTFLQ